MRLLLPAVCLAGCVIQQPSEPFPDEPPPGPQTECRRTCDSDEVCARDHNCYPPTRVRQVRADWTIRGQPASETSCTGLPSLYIRYEGPDDSLGYSPVPCTLGRFNIDKLPDDFTHAELGFDAGEDRFGGVTMPIGAEGVVVFDLAP
jgi:hypothetical protein